MNPPKAQIPPQRQGKRAVRKPYLIAFLALVSASLNLSAASYTWNGGAGEWNTYSLLWNTSTSAWPNTGTDNYAVFGGTAGTVAVDSGAVSVNRMTFSAGTVGEYIIGAPDFSLNLNGTAPQITTLSNARIRSDLTSTTGFTYAGSTGYLGLGGNNSGLSGTINVHSPSGRIRLESYSAGSANATWDIQNSILGLATSASFANGSGTVQLGALSGNSAGVLRADGDFGTVGGKPYNANVTYEVGALNTHTEFAGHVTDSVLNLGPFTTIIKIGTGSLTLSGASTYTGDTGIRNGTLIVGSDAVSTTIANAAVSSSSNAINYTDGATPLVNGDRVMFSGTVAAGLLPETTYYVINRTGTTFQVSTTPNGSALTFADGSMLVSEAGSLGSSTTAIYVGGGLTTSSDNVSLLINGAHTIERNLTVNDKANSYTLGGNSDHASRFSGNISLAKTTSLQSVTTGANAVTFSGVLSGAGGIVKTGSGRVAFSAANTYTGTTLVSSGTLILSGSGSIASSPTVDVASGATLDTSALGTYTYGSSQTLKGNGTIIGNTVIQGTLAAGNSPGILSFANNLTLDASNSQFEIQNTGMVRGTDYDGVNVGGILTYDGTLTLTMTTLISNGTYNLFDFVSMAGNFDSVVFSGAGYTGTFAYSSDFWTSTSNGQVFSFGLASGDLIVSAIPEPSTTLLLASALTALALFRRRRA